MRKILIWSGAIIVAAGLIWFFVLTKTFLVVTSDTGEFQVFKNGVTVGQVHKNGMVYLDKGQYAIAAVQQDKPVSLENLSTNIIPFQTTTIDSNTNISILGSQLALSRSADLITPLGSGFLYKNTTTRGIEYVDTDGISDLSSKFNIISKDLTSDNDSYNTVINIERDNDAVYVTTTRAIYRLTSLDNIQKSAFSDILITRSHLNTASHKIAFITYSNSGTYSAYSLSTDKIDGLLQQVYSGTRLINEITSNGSYAVVYDDNVPSTNSSTIAAFSKKKQVSPLLIDLKTSEQKSIPNLPNAVFTYIAISPDDTYFAYRTKLSSHIEIVSIKDGSHIASIPATTLTTLQWLKDKIIVNYGSLLVSYEVTGKKIKSQVVMTAPGQITNFSFNNQSPVIATNNGYVFSGVVKPVSVDMSKIILSSVAENYTINFSMVGNSLHIYRLCSNFNSCEPGSSYNSTIEQLSKFGDTNSATKDVTDDFSIGNYSYLQDSTN